MDTSALDDIDAGDLDTVIDGVQVVGSGITDGVAAIAEPVAPVSDAVDAAGEGKTVLAFRFRFITFI